jgi:hypothetical protein
MRTSAFARVLAAHAQWKGAGHVKERIGFAGWQIMGV